MNVATQPADVAAPQRAERWRSALVTAQRPPRPGAFAVCRAFGWRSILKIKHVPEQLFDTIATPIMFTLMFTYLFGGALAGSTDAYLQFLLPGILAQTVVFTSVYTGVTVNTDITRGVFDRFRSLPIWRPAPIIGGMLGDVVRYLISSAIAIVLGLILGFRPEAGALGVGLTLVLLLVFALGLSWVFVTVGLLLRTPASVMALSFMLLFPITFASNVFVDPATMPGWLQAIVNANPMTLLVTASRGLMDGTASFGQIALALIAPALITAVFGPLAMMLYRRKG